MNFDRKRLLFQYLLKIYDEVKQNIEKNDEILNKK